MTYQQWTTAIAPRVQGTQNLHAVLPQALDFFVLLSSINGILGNPSQANYAASSTYLDAFATAHSTASKPIVSLDLGWMGFAGTVAESAAISRRLASLNCLKPVSEAEMLGLLDYYCDGVRARRAASRQTTMGVSPRTSTGTATATMLDRPLWKHARMHASTPTHHSSYEPSSAVKAQQQEDKLSTQLAGAASPADAAAVVLAALLRQLAADLGVEQAGIDETRPVHEAGVDSLMAVQLRTWVKREMGANVSVFDLMGNKSLRDLSTIVVERSSFVVR